MNAATVKVFDELIERYRIAFDGDNELHNYFIEIRTILVDLKRSGLELTHVENIDRLCKAIEKQTLLKSCNFGRCRCCGKFLDKNQIDANDGSCFECTKFLAEGDHGPILIS